MAFEEVYFDGNEYVSVRRASVVLGKTEKYINDLCDGGELKAKKVGNDWFVSLESIDPNNNSLSNTNDTTGDVNGAAQILTSSKLLPARNTAMLLAVIVGLFVYSNFYTNAIVSPFDKVFFAADAYSKYVNQLSVKMVASVSDSKSVIKKDNSVITSFDPSILVKNISAIPNELSNLWVNSFIELSYKTLYFYRDLSFVLINNTYEILSGIAFAPSKLALVWADAYTDLNQEALNFNKISFNKIVRYTKIATIGPIKDASRGIAIVTDLNVEGHKGTEFRQEGLSANVISSLGENLNLLLLNIKVSAIRAGLFISDLADGSVSRWSDFKDRLFNLKVSEETNTEVLSSNFSLDEELLRQSIREEIKSELGAMLSNFAAPSSGVTKQSNNFSVSGTNDGVAVFPSSGDLLTDQEVINKIKNSFSDNVSVSLDPSGKAGVVRSNIPGDDGDYIFILSPIKSN